MQTADNFGAKLLFEIEVATGVVVVFVCRKNVRKLTTVSVLLYFMGF